MEKAFEELVKQLSTLLQQAGSSLERVWPDLVAQHAYTAWVYLIVSGALGLLGLVLLGAGVACLICAVKDKDGEGAGGATVLGLLALVCFLSVLGMTSNLAMMRYPEASLIRSLMGK